MTESVQTVTAWKITHALDSSFLDPPTDFGGRGSSSLRRLCGTSTRLRGYMFQCLLLAVSQLKWISASIDPHAVSVSSYVYICYALKSRHLYVGRCIEWLQSRKTSQHMRQICLSKKL